MYLLTPEISNFIESARYYDPSQELLALQPGLAIKPFPVQNPTEAKQLSESPSMWAKVVILNVKCVAFGILRGSLGTVPLFL